jgi:hypothetical protein
MARFVKLFALGTIAHAVIAFVLFSLVWLLPDGVGTTIAGAGFDVLSRPLMGPGAPAISSRPWLHWAQGVPLYLANSVLWGALVAAIAYPVLRRRRHN